MWLLLTNKASSRCEPACITRSKSSLSDDSGCWRLNYQLANMSKVYPADRVVTSTTQTAFVLMATFARCGILEREWRLHPHLKFSCNRCNYNMYLCTHIDCTKSVERTTLRLWPTTSPSGCKAHMAVGWTVTQSVYAACRITSGRAQHQSKDNDAQL